MCSFLVYIDAAKTTTNEHRNKLASRFYRTRLRRYFKIFFIFFIRRWTFDVRSAFAKAMAGQVFDVHLF